MPKSGSGESAGAAADRKPWPAVRIGRDRAAVVLRLHDQGRDLVLSIAGGGAHVGAVAVASPAGGTAGESCRELVVVPGHKEGPLAARAAERLAAVSGRTVVVVAGIHQDHAAPSEIEAIVTNVAAGVERLVEAITRRANDSSPAKDDS